MSNTVQPLIYIVDKNIAYQKVVEGCLNALKINNIRAFNDGELCYTSGAKPADLIILDYNLGEENWSGIEFMEEYSRLHPNTGFLFLSSNTGIEIAVESIRKGAVDYIVKSKPGLVRLAKQVEGIKLFHKKKMQEKYARQFLLGAILTISTLTIILSRLYSIG